YQDYFPIQIINSSYLNITGNTFYNTNLTIKAIGIDSLSYNLTLWYNNFYGSGINGTKGNTSGCYNNIGNYYQQGIPYSDMVNGECGLVNFTNDNSTTVMNSLLLNWTPQSSYKNINYTLEYVLNNVRTTITNIILTNYLFSVTSSGSYLLNIIPNDGYANGTIMNLTFNFIYSPSNPPGGGGGGNRPIMPELPPITPEEPIIVPPYPIIPDLPKIIDSTRDGNIITTNIITNSGVKSTLKLIMENVGLSKLKPKLIISFENPEIKGLVTKFHLFSFKELILILIMMTLIFFLVTIGKYVKLNIKNS
ncbi:MAG: hypothetical protein PHF86_09945, partial [Candidatus Nanoarchaeia archaeon]|nr:hypothetical protein [Candidatus Nanoarchaeia archaeon]